MEEQNPQSLSDTVRRWRKQLFWPALWVLTIFFICDVLLFRHPSSLDTAEGLHNITDNKKYYSTHSKTLAADDPTLNPNVFLNVSESNKVAVIIETRSSGFIVPLILHFHAVLGHSWPLIIYSEAENFGSFSTSASFVRLQKSGRIIVRPLAEGVYFPNWGSVSVFLTDPWLWNDLAPAENILIFQADSILCANSVRSVEDFFQYDMIGAPINPRYGQGYNGGLSLRKRKTFLRILEEFEYTPKSKPHMEDQWYYGRLKELVERDEEDGVAEKDRINLPSMEIARTFAVESIDYPSPLGFHQPMRFIHKHMVNIDEYCPEYMLVSKTRMKLEN